MGQRLFSRGNLPTARPAFTTMLPLQWGHDFSAVEM
jgi:hypothetical protein